jgi:hypothetical protein
VKLTNVLAARAFLSAERGETRAALEEALTAVRFGHRLQQAHGADLLCMMMGVNLEGNGLRIMREIAAHAPIDAALAREFANRLDGYRTEPEAWSRMWASEYQRHKSMWEYVRDPQTRRLESYEVAYLAGRIRLLAHSSHPEGVRVSSQPVADAGGRVHALHAARLVQAVR